MWKAYSADSIRQNRGFGASVAAAAFLAAFFLSLICSLFYNFWAYEIERIVLEDGDWQGRLTGELSGEALAALESWPNVERVGINEALTKGTVVSVDLRFVEKRAVYREMPCIAEALGLEESAVSYHELLLSRYMIHDPQDENPPLLMAFFLAVLLTVSVSLILIIHNSFALSMNARIHQFGILSSVGAAPGQILVGLLQESAAIGCVPVLVGSLLGIGGSFCAIQAVNFFAGETAGRHEAVFHYQPLVFGMTVLVSAVTVLVSAWIPAWKLSRTGPLQAIRGREGTYLRKKSRAGLLYLLFGAEGELAQNALRAQKAALRTSRLSLTLSFLGYTVMICFFTLTGISTDHTYFERYQDAWDVMVTLKNAGLEEWEKGEEIRALPGVLSSVAYQKADAWCFLKENRISAAISGLGGLMAVAGDSVEEGEGGYWVKAPVIILDDKGFEEYCEQIGAEPDTGGSILLNRIWDSVHSNFRCRQYVPFLEEKPDTVLLYGDGQRKEAAEVPVLGCTQQTPLLREEYEDYGLVQILPLSLWKQISGQLGGAGEDTYIRVLAYEGTGAEELDSLQEQIVRIVASEYEAETENRIREKETDARMQKGAMLILGAFCALLASIGVANVFSNTLGFLRQRRREFARYMSVGMTPAGICKMFCIEALSIAGRPLLIALPLTAAATAFMIRASYLDPAEFWARLPILPVAAFFLTVFVFVALAYYIGGRRMMKCCLTEVLKNDSME